MRTVVIITGRNMASVEGEAGKIASAFTKVGITPDVMQFDANNDNRYWDLAIWWTPFISNFVSRQSRWFTPKKVGLCVSYYVIEGYVTGMRRYSNWMKWQTVCTPSNFSKQMMESMGFRVNHVIPHQIPEIMPVDHEYGRNWRDRYPKDKKVILYNGSQIGRKALPKLAEAIKLLSKTRTDFIMVYHTDKLKLAFHTPIDQLAGANVVVEPDFPYIGYSKALGKMCYTDIVVHPAAVEGFGLPVLEALNLGKRLVCIAAPGVNEIATPRNSWMVTNVIPTTLNWSNFIKFTAVDYEPKDLTEQLNLCLNAKNSEIEEKRIEGLNTAKKYYNTYDRFVQF